MATLITIPLAFENMEEATIGSWLKAEGSPVQTGEALCELITEKTTFELPAEGAGLLRRILVPARAVIPVGTVIGIIAAADEELPEVAPPVPVTTSTAPEVPQPQPVPAAASATPAATAPAAGGRLRATPAARRAARELGVALEDIAAVNPGKVVSEDDVRRFAGQ